MSFTDGDVVEITYVGRIKNTGEIFDLTDRETAEEEGMDTDDMDLGPVKIMLGEGYVLEGLDDEIKKMDVGEKKTIVVPKDKAFGSRKSEYIRTISKKEFDNHDVRPRRGMPVEIDGKRGKILTVSSGRVKVDFNHPLSGRDLEYDVEILDAIDETEEKVEAVVSFHVKKAFDIDFDDGDVTVSIEGDVPEQLVDHLAPEIEKIDGVKNASIVSQDNDSEADED